LSQKVPLVILAAALLHSACQGPTKAQSAGPPPAVPVTFALATQEAVPVELHAIGTVEASSVIQVKPQVAGELTKADFVEGSMVNKGDLLFEIDKRPYIDAQRQAEALLAKDTALLQQAEANLAHDTAQAKKASSRTRRTNSIARTPTPCTLPFAPIRPQWRARGRPSPTMKRRSTGPSWMWIIAMYARRLPGAPETS
jgi:multidrug efflux pump subunit AcrA (membrane-fusion protein)